VSSSTLIQITPAKAERLIRAGKSLADHHVTGSLDLRGCDLKGITLPTSVGGSLDLSGCDLKGITLPTSVGGWLDLRGCDLKGITLPTSVTRSIYLRGCDLKGITLPTSVGGSLDLSGCDLKGITLPTSVTGSLDLRGARNVSADMWWSENAQATLRHCIAICPTDGYALIQTDTDRFTAGCWTDLTRKQALKHWDRPDARAKMFTAAIKAHMLAQQVPA
jgi:hypothetical protein